MSWEDAQTYCRQHYTDLAMIEDETENTAVSDLFTAYYVWIGLYREAWRWSDGSQSNFTNWYSTEPNNSILPCVREQNTFLWNTVPCHWLHPFICEQGERNHKKVMKRPIIAATLYLLFMIGEIIGGYMSSSLAIMTDACTCLICGMKSSHR
ncbi:hypothetical protein WMY93_027025 [Mugilogobius chulae]|uniref:C-type lectin domain-containing protein n=1 Tax=Mugilogobius chulae TaxID=88201 RepID=A0AAW0N3J2_9GOBI